MKVLWVKSELLHPVDKGGKIRTLEMLRHLMRNHEVTYVCLASPTDTQEAFESARDYCHRLVTVPWSEPPRFSKGFYLELAKNVVSPLPYVIEKYRQPQMLQWIAREDARGAFDVVVCDFLSPSANVPKKLRAATVLFEHNVETILWERTYKNEQNPAKKAYFYAQYQKMRAYENALCHRYQTVAAVSTNDAEAIRDLFQIRDAYPVPTGVDFDFFAPLVEGGTDGRPAKVPREKADLVFTGSMDWMPNEDAILWFADAVLPRIAASVPDVKVTVVGRNPTPKLKELAAREPRIVLTGRVDDVRPYIERSSVYIVPIRVGGGTRIKIYEAMGMARAVVSTTIGAEGLPVANGQEIVIADEPNHFADEVVRLVRDEGARSNIEQAARKAVVERFGWNRATDALVEIMQRALDKHRLG
ncbi:MAG: glycosyltransferase [Polyangiaceae bacterium]|nr:glycosyltransferase [Polyangiaceae bacterium]